MNTKPILKLAPILAALGLAACGGGGSSDTNIPIAPAPSASSADSGNNGGNTPAPVATNLSAEQQKALLRRVAQDMDAIRTATLTFNDFTDSDDRVMPNADICRSSGTASLQYQGQTQAAGTTLAFETSPGDYVATYSQCNSFQHVQDGVVNVSLSFSAASGEGKVQISTAQFTQPSIDNGSTTLKGAVAGTLKIQGASAATTTYTPAPGLVSEGSGLALSYVSGQLVDVSPAAGQLTTQAQALSFTSGGTTYVAQGELTSNVSTSGLSLSGTVAVTTAGGARVGNIRREVLTDWVIEPASASAAGQ